MMGFQIADQWFAIERISDDISRIWEPHAIRLMQCNIWHVRGRDRDLLIDTGFGVASLREAVRHLFDKPVSAVATHAHIDHVGAMFEFDDRIIHQAEAAALAADSANFSLYRDDHPAADIESLERAGYEVGPAFITALPRADFNLAVFSRRAAPATRTVVEGDLIDLGNRVFEVLHLPGHSPGSIGLWEAATATLFSGDAIYDGPLLDELPGSDVAAYLDTMRRLATLDARVVHAGHDPSFDGRRLKVLAQEYLDRRARAVRP
jgi:glyoxylase-like metal-dependent hydrolase (beta-lactamase superfamily II)